MLAPAPTPRGLLLALEGIDGSGTTTQARLLCDWLARSGRRAHLTCEPSRGPIGTLLRSVLRRELGRGLDAAAVALLFAADRVDHIEHELEPALASGAHVVTDRYLASSLAYQSVELELDWVRAINARAPAPDLTLYLRVDPAIARDRRAARGEAEELFDAHLLQQRISARYDAILGSGPEAGAWILDPADGSRWIRRDPAGSSLGSSPGSGSGSSSGCNGLGSSGGSGAGSGPVAILDGALAPEILHEQIVRLVEKVAPAIGS